MEKLNVQINSEEAKLVIEKSEFLKNLENYNIKEISEFDELIIYFIAEKEVALDNFQKLCKGMPDIYFLMTLKNKDGKKLAEFINENGKVSEVQLSKEEKEKITSSGGYGYFCIDVVTKDGMPDEAKAKEVYDHCMNNYNWCSDEGLLVLRDHEIVNNDDDYPDGIELNTDIPTDDFEWLCEAQAETGAERIVAEVVSDYSQSSYEENFNRKALIEDGEVKEETQCNYNSFVMGEVDSGSRYPALNISCNAYKAKFRNKKTGKEVLGGLVYIYPNEGYDDVFEACCDEEYHYVFVNNEEALLLDENGDPTCVEDFDHFSDDYDIMSDFDFPGESYDNASDWEFIGFDTQPSLFDKYASNPQAEEYEEIC